MTLRIPALRPEADRLRAALDALGDRAAPDLLTDVATALDGVDARLERGAEHTVAALVGGTGSGKSSIFNALAGMALAEVGVQRPTTSTVSACAWVHGAGPLLDRLEVAADRRLERETVLDGEDQADLRGLVLLDLPDHDSLATAHHALVSHLLPSVDLLVWVVDPQKYADDALHTGYLVGLAGHQTTMLVVLNQVDTVPAGARAALLADVRRLLRQEGLGEVPVLATSTTTGEGMDALRAVLADRVAGRRVAELRGAAELADAARLLLGQVAAAEPDPPVGRAVDALLEAGGVPGAVAGLTSGAPAGEGSLAPATLGPVQPDRVSLVREAWLAEVAAGLPAPWADAIAQAVAADDALVAALDAALAQVLVPSPPRPWWSRRPRPRDSAAAAAVLLASARTAVSGVVEVHLAGPTREVLAAHEAVRAPAQAVLADLSTGPAPTDPSPA